MRSHRDGASGLLQIGQGPPGFVEVQGVFALLPVGSSSLPKP